jgi:uncharacterized membrane protein (UPF0182 family)
VSFLTADSDPGQYGRLRSFVMPQGENVQGPVQVNNAIIRTPAISTAITLLNQQGSSIIQGSMQLIPVGDTLLYVRPFYAQGRGSGSYPQFQFVVVYAQGRGAFCAPTVEDGLKQLTGQTSAVTTCSVANGATSGGTGSGSPAATTTTTPGTATTTPTATTVPPATGSSADLIAQAANKYDQAQAALKNGDFTTYATLIQEVGTLIKQAQTQAAAGK